MTSPIPTWLQDLVKTIVEARGAGMVGTGAGAVLGLGGGIYAGAKLGEGLSDSLVDSMSNEDTDPDRVARKKRLGKYLLGIPGGFIGGQIGMGMGAATGGLVGVGLHQAMKKESADFYKEAFWPQLAAGASKLWPWLSNAGMAYAVGSEVAPAVNPLSSVPGMAAGFRDLTELIANKSPLERTIFGLDPEGAMDYYARGLESQGEVLYDPIKDPGNTGMANFILKDNLRQYPSVYGNASKVWNGLFPEESRQTDGFGLPQEKNLFRRLQMIDGGKVLEGTKGLAGNMGNLMETAKDHPATLRLHEQDRLGGIFRSVGGMFDSEKPEGYKNPLQATGDFLGNAAQEVSTDLKRIRQGDAWGGATHLLSSPLRTIGLATGGVAADMGGGVAGERFLKRTVLPPKEGEHPPTSINLVMGANTNAYRGASDTAPWALARALRGEKTPEGYKSVGQHFQTAGNDLGTWGQNLLKNPGQAAQNAWNNPYGRAAIVGTGGLAALGGLNALRKKKKDEEEFRTRGLHRLGAY